VTLTGLTRLQRPWRQDRPRRRARREECRRLLASEAPAPAPAPVPATPPLNGCVLQLALRNRGWPAAARRRLSVRL